MGRVLITRLSAMGDILHAMPAVTALRAARPDWEIGWLIEERWQPLLRAHAGAAPRSSAQPLVDRVHRTNMAKWRQAWLARETRQQIAALVRELRQEGYDAVIDLQGAIRSALLARAARPRSIVGEDDPREWLARLFFTERVSTTGIHVVEQDLEVASAMLGERLTYTPALLPHDKEAAQWAEGFQQGRPLVLVNPGAGWGAKCWPAERYGRVAQWLWNHGCTVLVNAGPSETMLANQVVNESGNTARVVECTIPQLIELTRRSTLFIGGDTGPLHLAAALNTPVVALFGPTDPARNGPFATKSVVLRSPKSRRDHTRRPQPEEGLLTITPDQVLAAARNFLGVSV